MHLLRRGRRAVRHRGAGRRAEGSPRSRCAATCGGYLKTVDVPRALAVSAARDLPTRDDGSRLAAMEHGYGRPPLKDFASEREPRKQRRDFVRSAINCADGFAACCARLLLDVLVQRVAVRVHRHDRGKVFDGQMPHRLGRAELEQRHAVDLRDRRARRTARRRRSRSGRRRRAPSARRASSRPCRPCRSPRARRSA